MAVAVTAIACLDDGRTVPSESLERELKGGTLNMFQEGRKLKANTDVIYKNERIHRGINE